MEIMSYQNGCRNTPKRHPFTREFGIASDSILPKDNVASEDTYLSIYPVSKLQVSSLQKVQVGRHGSFCFLSSGFTSTCNPLGYNIPF